MRVPQRAQLDHEALRNLNTTLTEPVERQKRALIAEFMQCAYTQPHYE